MTKILICGEAYGKDEADLEHPFVGMSGSYLIDLLSQVGLLTLTKADRENRNEYFRSRNPYFNMLVWQAHPELRLTNVFNLRPANNDVENLCGPKSTALPGFPAVKNGKYIREEFKDEIARLYREIAECTPNVVIALGATPTLALLRQGGIKKQRGAPAQAPAETRQHTGQWLGKVIPTYHPAAMMRDWSLRPIILSDLDKARRQSEFPEVIRPSREVWVEPTIADLLQFERDYIRHASRLSIDIETKGNQITCIGFAPSRDRAIVIPIYNPMVPDGNYWRTHADEMTVWTIIKRWLALPIPKVFQNGLYDMTFLWRSYGIKTWVGDSDDTMLLHHALQPEMEKGLGFLGTLYTEEASWKFMRTKHDTVKRED